MRMSVENGIVAFIVLVVVVVVELVIEGLEDEDRFAEDEDDYDIAAFTNNSIFSASRTLKVKPTQALISEKRINKQPHFSSMRRLTNSRPFTVRSMLSAPTETRMNRSQLLP